MTNPDRNGSLKGQKLVIIGGVAGGASCATRARRLDESAEILLIQVCDSKACFRSSAGNHITDLTILFSFVPYALINSSVRGKFTPETVRCSLVRDLSLLILYVGFVALHLLFSLMYRLLHVVCHISLVVKLPIEIRFVIVMTHMQYYLFEFLCEPTNTNTAPTVTDGSSDSSKSEAQI